MAAIFNDDMTPASLEERMGYITKVLDSSVSADDVLDALGYYCHEKGLLSSCFPYFLQKLYNAEALEAEDILKYYAEDKPDPVYTQCQTQAQPFLKWLREAAEASSSDEDDN